MRNTNANNYRALRFADLPILRSGDYEDDDMGLVFIPKERAAQITNLDVSSMRVGKIVVAMIEEWVKEDDEFLAAVFEVTDVTNAGYTLRYDSPAFYNLTPSDGDLVSDIVLFSEEYTGNPMIPDADAGDSLGYDPFAGQAAFVVRVNPEILLRAVGVESVEELYERISDEEYIFTLKFPETGFKDNFTIVGIDSDDSYVLGRIK